MKRYAPAYNEAGNVIEDPDGEYVRLADVIRIVGDIRANSQFVEYEEGEEPRCEVRDGVMHYPDLCEHCDPVGTFGLSNPDNPRLVRCDDQYFDANGIAHDPIMHEVSCPVAQKGNSDE